MKKHYMLFTLLFTLLPFLNSHAEENKAITIPQLSFSSPTSGYRLEIPETILGDRNGGETDRSGKSFTISAWINMDQYTNNSGSKGTVIMGHGPRVHMNYNGSLVLATTETGVLKIISGASNKVTSVLETSVDLDTWTYLTLVYDNSDFSVSVYKDGTLVATKNNTQQLELFGDDPCIFFVGGAGFSGFCDEFQFFDRALNSNDVKQAYSNPQNISGLTVWYDFNTIEEGSSFTNKVTESDQVNTKATFYNLTGGQTNSDGGYISITNYTEAVPSLTEGRPTPSNYTVTLPTEITNGTLSVMNGESPLSAGENTVASGTTLTITATPADNYRLESLNINGQPIENGGTYTVTEDATITVSFVEIVMHKVTITVDEGVDYQITAGEEVIENLESIASGTELTITFNSLPENKKIESVLINEQPAEAEENGSYIFTVTENTTIIVNLTDITYYTVTLPTLVENGQLSVMNGSEPLTTGENTGIKEGTVLTITATADPGYEILSLQVNGSDFTNGDNYTVNENTTVTVSFQIEGPKAVLVPAISGNNKYQFRFDDKVLGEHINGENNSWNNGNITGSDHRARNFTMSAWVKTVSTNGQVMGHGQAPYYGAVGTFGVVLENGVLKLKARAWEDKGNCPGIADVTTEATLTADEWAFITVTVDDSNKEIKLYKNGKLLGTGDLGTIVEGGEREGHGIGLLQDECVFFVGNGGFSCYVDEVQVWTKTLTEKEVKESIRGGYDQENMPEELVAYYKIENDSEAELENKGTFGSCPAGVVEGTTEVHTGAPHWGAEVYTCDFITVQIVAGHTFPTNNLTITQPTEGGTFKVVNAKNEEVTSGAVDQFSALTVIAEPEEGYVLSQVLVNGEVNSGTTFVIEDDTEVTVVFSNKVIVTNTTATGGNVEMFVNDAEEATAFGSEIIRGSKLTFKVTVNEGYELTSFLVNEEEKIDELAENIYTVDAISDNMTICAVFSKIPTWRVTCNVTGNGSVTISDDESNVYASGSEILNNTFVKLTFIPEENYKVDAFTTSTGESLLDQISDNIYEIGAIDSNHTYNVTFGTIVGIDKENIKSISLYYQDGILYVNGIDANTTIAIYNLTGKLVKVTEETPVNVADLTKGCYIVKITMGNTDKAMKFIKK